MKLNVHRKSFAIASLVIGITQLAHAATVLQFDNFDSRPSSGTLSGGTGNEAASGWKNVAGLTGATALNGSVTATDQTAHNFWDQTGNGVGQTASASAFRIRNTIGMVTTDNIMNLVTLGATAATMKWDWKAQANTFAVGLYYAHNADSTISAGNMVLLGTFAGGGAAGNVNWQNASVTVTDGVGGITFTDTARFVLKTTDAAGSANSTFQTIDNIEISYIPEPSSALLGGLGLLVLLRRRR